MINIDFSSLANVNTFNNHYNSIVIIGKGNSQYKNIQITKPENLTEVEKDYGTDSELTLAYKEAVEVGAVNIYLCNCYKFSDYIKALDLIVQNNFSYVVPLFLFSITFMNPTNNRETYLSELYTEALEESQSVLILTEQHASLYEDIEHYLRTSKSINYNFKEKAASRLINGHNLCFVLNNLSNYKFANVVLASVISQSSLREYPSKSLGEVVFDITNDDLYNHEIVYFAYNILSDTTIENLQNYHNEPAPEKMLLISIIKNRINASLDYEAFTGTLINAYTKIKLESHTTEVLKGFVGNLIDNFEILKIAYIKAGIGQVNIEISMSIKPYNSIENIYMKVEV